MDFTANGAEVEEEVIVQESSDEMSDGIERGDERLSYLYGRRLPDTITRWRLYLSKYCTSASVFGEIPI
jgi:hypothetical protein